MRVVRRVMLMLAAGALVVPVASAGAAAVPAQAVAQAQGAPTLVAVRAAHHPGFDRVVFEFTGRVPASRRVIYVNRLIGDPSGLPVLIAGRAILQVRFEAANAHNDVGRATAPGRIVFPLPNVMTAVRSGDFEAVTSYGIGLAKKETFKVFTLSRPSRVVIDVKAGFPTVTRKVWFFNQRRFVANREPFFTPVLRPVRPLTAATGVMDRLFAGPLPGEAAAGLTLLRSDATGFTGPQISGGVARVRLTGGCNSHGSTVTVAGEIMPTLRQLASVDFVKISDPAGRTEHPTGRRDSIPTCLEP